MSKVTVRDLKAALQGVDESLPVLVGMHTSEGDEYTVGMVVSMQVDCGCSDDDAFVIVGDDDDREDSPWIDMGHSVEVMLRHYQGKLAGLMWRHNEPNGKPCSVIGFIPFAGADTTAGDAGWKVVNEEPLTLDPSLLCRACQCHGFVKDGKWVKA